MRRVYRLAARDEMETKKASRLIYMLTQMRAALEVATLEDRVAMLEARP